MIILEIEFVQEIEVREIEIREIDIWDIEIREIEIWEIEFGILICNRKFLSLRLTLKIANLATNHQI